MPDNGAATHGRPPCRCHGVPLASNGPGKAPECRVRRRARQMKAYADDPASDNYARTRRRLRARITEKRQRIAQLEEHLAEEITG